MKKKHIVGRWMCFVNFDSTIMKKESLHHLDRLNMVEQFFLKTVRAELSKEDWEKIQEAYFEAIKLANQPEKKVQE